MKYIGAEKLKTEIERLTNQKKEKLKMFSDEDYTCSVASSINCELWGNEEVLSIIKSLQQEQPEVDLDEEITTWIPSHITGGEKGVWKECREAVTKWAGIVARHFYELGLSARKEE